MTGNEVWASNSPIRRISELHGTSARVIWTCSLCDWRASTEGGGRATEDDAAAHLKVHLPDADPSA